MLNVFSDIRRVINSGVGRGSMGGIDEFYLGQSGERSREGKWISKDG